MITVGIALLLVAWLIRHRPIAAAGFAFLLISFVWRLIAVAYMGITSPVYSKEAEIIVTTDGLSVTAFGAAILLTVLALAWVFRPQLMDAKLDTVPLPAPTTSFWRLGNIVFLLSTLFVVALYVDLARIGIIPVLSCMERYEYTNLYAGLFHQVLYKYGSLIALQMGTFAVYPRLQGRPYDSRFLILVAAILVYGALTGNRFSLFYSFTLFFLTPLSLLLAMHVRARLRPLATTTGRMHRWLTSPWLLSAVAAALLTLIIVTLLNSYANVRSNDSVCRSVASTYTSQAAQQQQLPSQFALTQITEGWLGRIMTPETIEHIGQRILVQPVYVWFATWDRVVTKADFDPRAAFDFVFDNAEKRNGNRSIRYLMNRMLPPKRAAYLESVGNQFAGGFPGILLELFGPWLTWLPIIGFALITAWLLRAWMLAALNGHFITAFFAAYVYYAFVVMYIGGMLNFLIVGTFWAKITLFAFFAWYEPRRQRQGRPLLSCRPPFSRKPNSD